MNIVSIMMWCGVKGLRLHISKDLTFKITTVTNGLVLSDVDFKSLQKYCS